MSAGYGYYSMKFYKNDLTEDADAAKRAFDWIYANLEWAKEENPFVLSGNRIGNNEADYPDGVNVKGNDIPLEVDWFEDVCKAAGVEKASIQVTADYSDSSYDENYWYEGAFKDGKLEVFDTIQFNSAREEPAVLDNIGGDSVPWAYDSSTFRHCQHKYKYKPTGKVCLGGHYYYPYADDDEDEEYAYELEFSGMSFDDVSDDPEIIIDGFNDLSEEEKEKKVEELRDSANWEDLGMESQPSRADVYLGLAEEFPSTMW